MTGLQRISLEHVVRVKRDELILDDGSVIPLHRIVAVEASGKKLWCRGCRPDEGARDERIDQSQDEGS